MTDVANVKLGVCDVTYGGSALGYTQGGCEFTYTPDWHETEVDQETGVVKLTLVSERCTARVPLAESTLNNLNIAIPTGTNTGTELQVGGKRTATAQELVLTPIDGSESITIYKALCTSEITIGYTKDGERITECTFIGLVDTTKTEGNKLFKIG